jgi:hypothetical protein
MEKHDHPRQNAQERYGVLQAARFWRRVRGFHQKVSSAALVAVVALEFANQFGGVVPGGLFRRAVQFLI